jgi:hypothetical protein
MSLLNGDSITNITSESGLRVPYGDGSLEVWKDGRVGAWVRGWLGAWGMGTGAVFLIAMVPNMNRNS